MIGAAIQFVRYLPYRLRKLRRFFYGIRSIGWDIAFTEEGPTFLEASDQWAMRPCQIPFGGLRRKYKDMPGP